MFNFLSLWRQGTYWVRFVKSSRRHPWRGDNFQRLRNIYIYISYHDISRKGRVVAHSATTRSNSFTPMKQRNLVCNLCDLPGSRSYSSRSRRFTPFTSLHLHCPQHLDRAVRIAPQCRFVAVIFSRAFPRQPMLKSDRLADW